MEKKAEEAIDLEVENVAGGEPSEQKQELRNVFVNVLQKGMTIMQAIGFPPGLLEMIYGYASELYKAGKYEDANPLFFFLSQLNPRDSRFLFGCAASFHKLKRYPEASTYYLLSSGIDPENPYPFYHAADCFLQANQPEAAIVLLEKAIMVAGESEKYEKLRQQAYALREVIQKHVEEKEKNSEEQEVEKQ